LRPRKCNGQKDEARHHGKLVADKAGRLCGSLASQESGGVRDPRRESRKASGSGWWRW
jgi:hypothetical protein